MVREYHEKPPSARKAAFMLPKTFISKWPLDSTRAQFLDFLKDYSTHLDDLTWPARSKHEAFREHPRPTTPIVTGIDPGEGDAEFNLILSVWNPKTEQMSTFTAGRVVFLALSYDTQVKLWGDHEALMDFWEQWTAKIKGDATPDTQQRARVNLLPSEEGQTVKVSSAIDMDVTGGLYGTDRDLTIDEVRDIVARCLAFKEKGGKVPEFYKRQNLIPREPRYYELDTLRKWIRNPKLIPKDTQKLT